MTLMSGRHRTTSFGKQLYRLLQKLLLLLLLRSASGFLDFRATTMIASHAPRMVTSDTRGCFTIASAVNDNEAAAATTTGDQRCGIDSGSTGEGEDTGVRQNLRRKVPYVESFEEQATRELWEKHPFRGAEHVVDAIILGFGDDDGDGDTRERARGILTPVESEPSESLSGYEDSFAILYQRRNAVNVDSNDESTARGNARDALGTPSVASSPFAFVAEREHEKLRHFCLTVAYRGEDFCGWQTQLHNEKPSVQRTLEEWLTELQNNNHHQPLDVDTGSEIKAQPIRPSEDRDARTKKPKKSKGLRWADLPVSGRTDSGVSAIGQLCRFRTHRGDLTAKAIQDYLHDKLKTASNGSNNSTISRSSLRVTKITQVSRAFHPTFTVSCRAYAYLIDIGRLEPATVGLLADDDKTSRVRTQVELLDALLRKVEGKILDYVGLSYGRVKTANTLCTLYHARARCVGYCEEREASHDSCFRNAVCIELVGDRFLRRMVRLLVEASLQLVATAVKKEGAESGDDGGTALLELIERRDRRLVGKPAPPNGLIFVGPRVQTQC